MYVIKHKNLTVCIILSETVTMSTRKATIPFTASSPVMISGPTGCGKTYFVYKLLKHNMFTQPISKVLYCYGVYQELYNQFKLDNLEFHEGLPSLEKVQNLNDGRFNVIILDDLMEFIVKSIETQNLFTKFCHHFNITAIFLTQNIFANGPNARSININTHILVLFANKRDESQAMHLAKQIYPTKTKGFMEAYYDATNSVFGYLVIDCNPRSHRMLKLRANIFPDETTYVYVVK